jgi:ribonuclease-3
MRAERLADLERIIGHDFADRGILVEALSHASTRQEGLGSNERMEFLGDAVLGFLVSDHLYREHPELQEGELTARRMQVVSRNWLWKIGEALRIDEFVAIGKGLSQSGGSSRRMLADAVEALLGAVYLDGGVEPARQFVVRHVLNRDADPDNGQRSDYKSQLQHHAQRHQLGLPTYLVLEESGPEHAKVFTVRVELAGRTFAAATGRNKKEAERRAARLALEVLRAEARDPES